MTTQEKLIRLSDVKKFFDEENLIISRIPAHLRSEWDIRTKGLLKVMKDRISSLPTFPQVEENSLEAILDRMPRGLELTKPYLTNGWKAVVDYGSYEDIVGAIGETAAEALLELEKRLQDQK